MTKWQLLCSALILAILSGCTSGDDASGREVDAVAQEIEDNTEAVVTESVDRSDARTQSSEPVEE